MEKYIDGALNYALTIGVIEIIVIVLGWGFAGFLLRAAKKVTSISNVLANQLEEMRSNKVKIEELVDQRIADKLKEFGLVEKEKVS